MAGVTRKQYSTEEHDEICTMIKSYPKDTIGGVYVANMLELFPYRGECSVSRELGRIHKAGLGLCNDSDSTKRTIVRRVALIRNGLISTKPLDFRQLPPGRKRGGDGPIQNVPGIDIVKFNDMLHWREDDAPHERMVYVVISPEYTTNDRFRFYREYKKLYPLSANRQACNSVIKGEGMVPLSFKQLFSTIV